jgi:hypothetical protein
MNKLGIITQVKLKKEIIRHYIKAYNNKRLDESQKINAMICKQQSPRERDL